MCVCVCVIYIYIYTHTYDTYIHTYIPTCVYTHTRTYIGFWARVFGRAAAVNAVLSETDEEILTYLLDVRTSGVPVSVGLFPSYSTCLSRDSAAHFGHADLRYASNRVIVGLFSYK
jgi:hypothetical protein